MTDRRLVFFNKAVALLLAVALILPLSLVSTAFAQEKPEIRFVHNELSYFIPRHRIQLMAEISDSQGIKHVRCYFRSSASSTYVYVDMTSTGENGYKCLLPSPLEFTKSIEYFFLVVNAKTQVIRTRSYFIPQKEGTIAPKWQQTSKTSIIELKNELGDDHFELIGFQDPHMSKVNPVAHALRFGLVAGIYDPLQIPASAMAAPGHFGGFLKDKKGLSTTAIVGLGVGLAAVIGGGVALSGGGGGGGGSSSSSNTNTNTAPPVGPDIRGDWSGVFWTTGVNNRQAVSATIEQNGSAVTILTSLSGLGHNFIGNINANGHMFLYDQFDGEDWTTHFGPASTTNVTIADFICPSCDDLNIIKLTR